MSVKEGRLLRKHRDSKAEAVVGAIPVPVVMLDDEWLGRFVRSESLLLD